MAAITDEELLKSAQRELALRRRVYPKWVAREKMTQEDAAHEICCMEAIVKILDERAGRLC
jgi:hypothetical protein